MGACIASLTIGTADPLILGVAAGATQLPDVDTTRSFAGKLLFPAARFIENRFPHRTLTHSFFATGLVTLFALPLRFFVSAALWQAAIIGYFCGWFADVFTKQGVAAFYPFTSARLVVPDNPRLRLSTGSRAEYVLTFALAALFIASLQMNTAGGLMRVFSGLLGQTSSAVELFNKEGSRKEIIAHIEGEMRNTDISADFFVEGVEGDAVLIVRDAAGILYTAGDFNSCSNCNIAIHRVNAKTARDISTNVREIRLDGQDVAETLRSRQMTAANSRVTFSGEIVLQDAENLKLETSLQRFNTLSASGNETKTVRLRFASPSDLSRLSGYDASGTLLMREVKFDAQ